METKYGFPVVNSENVFSVLEELGLKKWSKIEGPISLNDYIKRDLTDQQKKEIERFAPEIEMDIFQDPTGESFTGFRPVWRYGKGAHVFTILPGDLIPIAAEFRHGAEVISLILPGGVVENNDPNPGACAKREFEAETGIKLEKVIPLETEDTTGIPVSARQIKQRTCGFLGILPDPLVIDRQSLDHKEFLKIVLILVSEWDKLINKGKVKEASPIISTYHALRRLDRLVLIGGNQ